MIADVRYDAESLETAAFELLEEALAAQYRKHLAKRLDSSPNLENAMAVYQTERSLAAGYYEWAAHLFLLERGRELRVFVTPDDMQAVEAHGLVALAAGRARFQDAHPPCRHCGMPLFERLAGKCQICSGDLRKKAS